MAFVALHCSTQNVPSPPGCTSDCGDRFSSDEFADEVLNRWREGEGRVAEAMQSLGEELAAAREGYAQVKQLDDTLFAKDYESL